MAHGRFFSRLPVSPSFPSVMLRLLFSRSLSILLHVPAYPPDACVCNLQKGTSNVTAFSGLGSDAAGPACRWAPHSLLAKVHS